MGIVRCKSHQLIHQALHTEDHSVRQTEKRSERELADMLTCRLDPVKQSQAVLQSSDLPRIKRTLSAFKTNHILLVTVFNKTLITVLHNTKGCVMLIQITISDYDMLAKTNCKY